MVEFFFVLLVFFAKFGFDGFVFDGIGGGNVGIHPFIPFLHGGFEFFGGGDFVFVVPADATSGLGVDFGAVFSLALEVGASFLEVLDNVVVGISEHVIYVEVIVAGKADAKHVGGAGVFGAGVVAIDVVFAGDAKRIYPVVGEGFKGF